MCKSVIPLVLIVLISFNWVSFSTANGGYAFRLPIPHQLGNLIDLIAPIHIRFATDGVKHHP